jgi:hypothetical protein
VLGLSGLFWSLVKGRPILTEEELASDNDSAHSKPQFEIEDGQYVGRSWVGRTLRYPLRIFSKSKPTSIFLVGCVVARALILRRIVLGIECAGDGVEVRIALE